MTTKILAAESTEFLAAAAAIPVFTPRHRTTGPFTGGRLQLGHGEAWDLAGLDYLALGSAPQVKAIMRQALADHDCAIPGSEAVIQTHQTHALEQALGRLHFGDSGTAATFSSGYSANFAVMEALGLRTNSHFLRMHRATIPPGDSAEMPTIFFLDGDLHFSARHGIRFATKLYPEGCHSHTYRTGDHEMLEQLVERSWRELGDRAVRIIVTDSVESATGQEFDLGGLCALAERYDCLLYVDEAHAVGVLGPQGRGVTAALTDYDRYRHRLIIMGTLTKAFCQPGGYVAMSDPGLAALIKFCSPQHVFSAPIAPWTAAASVRVLELVAGPFGDQLRERLARLSRYARQALTDQGFELVAESDTPILALALNSPDLGDEVLEYMGLQGFLVSIFQAPLRAIGHEVVRIGLRADLSYDDIDRLVSALQRCRDKVRFC